jgi:cellulose synthase/poly-beta-1,6-N-acetylglucosamine synthase-like glycosyltransferase
MTMPITEIVFWLSLAVLFYTYLGYPLLLACRSWLPQREASRPDDAFLPQVSIVLAAYNEANHIRNKLENCLALDYPHDRLEILVGSDGSDDGTDDIIREFQDRSVKLLAFSPRRGKMATVNRVVREAKGEICVFSDVSEVFDLDAVKKLTRHFADPSIGAVTGNHIYHSKKTGLGAGTSFYWKFQRLLQRTESRIFSVCACDGTIYACRRALFPFPPDPTINDDMAVPLGILLQGKRVIFEPEAVARGEVLPETQRFFRQKVRGQAGRYQVFALFPRMFVPWPMRRWGIFLSHSVLPVLVPWFLALALVSNIVLLFGGPWIYQVFMALQALFALAALVGYIAEKRRIYLGLGAIPFYFVLANFGSLCGFFAYISGVQRAAWRKVE